MKHIKSGKGVRMTGSLEGHVYDAEIHRPIEGVSVEIAGLRATTDTEGHYRIDGIPAGIHVVRRSIPSHKTLEDLVEI